MAIIKSMKKMEMPTAPEGKGNLAIAYSIKNKNKKKMASGGAISANDEKRAMPDETFNDSQDVSQNSGNKKSIGDSWTDNKKDSMKPSPTRLSQPKEPSFTPREDEEESDLIENDAPKMMASGGPVDLDEEAPHSGETMEDMLRRHADEIRGLSSDDDSMEVPHESEKPHSMAEAIMRKRKMADGGQVDLEANSEESPNMEDKYSFEANGKEQYDLDQLSSQPSDSNESGDSRESDSENKDDESLISQIRAKLKAKRGM